MASVTMFCNNLIGRFLTAAARSNGNFHAFTFLPLNADLADGFKALGNFVVGRRLGTDCP
ncbi:hypothetical protein SAMN03159488_02995 [Pseudomonas sp. NFIX10]|nr:hypothetical protein SAMN03159488_02995 [Pseudomonas sp. NFIX10]SFF29638.1 hypothetical protein SAMN03159367_03862 [Pseudomonas sp. NFACC06-1]